MKHQHFIPCSCETEGLYITKYEDEPETYVAIFKHGYNPKCKSLWNKVRYIWQIVATGQPFGDDIVLSKSDALRLSSLLNSLYK